MTISLVMTVNQYVVVFSEQLNFVPCIAFARSDVHNHLSVSIAVSRFYAADCTQWELFAKTPLSILVTS